MNSEERAKLARLITATAMYYQRPITTEVISMMADDLDDLNFESVSEGYLKYRRNPKNKFFPLPAQIRDIVAPEETTESGAREQIALIKLAIEKFGWPEPLKAEEFMGPIAWQIVKEHGGWQRMCESNFFHNSGLLAQARNRAEDLIKHQFIFGNLKSLPTPRPYEFLESSEAQDELDL